MKRISCVLFVLLTIFAFVGCDNFGPKQPVQNVKSFDFSDYSDKNNKVTLSENTELNLSGLSLENGFYFSSFDSNPATKGVKEPESSKNLFKTQDGSFIAIPDKNNKAIVRGKQLGVYSDDVEVYIYKFASTDSDLSINSDESKYENLAVRTVDEFYYINLDTDPRFNTLKKDDIVFIAPAYGGYCEASIISYLYDSKDMKSVHDFSDCSDFGLYMYLSYGQQSESQQDDQQPSQWNYTIHILNTTSIPEDAKGVSIENEISVLKVENLTSGSYYTIKAVCSSYQIARDLMNNLASVRYTDGRTRNCLIPYVRKDESSNYVVTIYMGAFDGDFIFDYVPFVESAGSINFTIEDSDASAFPILLNLTTMGHNGADDGKIIAFDSSTMTDGFYTVPYVYSGKCVISNNSPIDPISNCELGQYSFCSGYPKGPSYHSDNTCRGFFVFDLANLADKQVFFSMSSDAEKYISASHIKYDREQKYVDDNNQLVCTYGDILNLYEYTSFVNRKCVNKDKGVSIKGLINGSFDNEGQEIPFTSSANVVGPNQEFGQKLSYSENANINLVYYLQEAWFDNSGKVTKIKCDVQVNLGPKTAEDAPDASFDGLILDYVHEHDWQIIDDFTVECECGKKCNYISRFINEGTVSMTTSALRNKDNVEVWVPDLNYIVSLPNGTVTFPPLEQGAEVFFISPSDNCFLTLTGGGDVYKLHATYK